MSDGEWKPPREGDVRSPCPVLNCLANHGYLPRDGKNWEPNQVAQVILDKLNLSKSFSWPLAKGVAMKIGHDGKFDLDKLATHGNIEHDASLTRQDYGVGDNLHVNQGLVDQLLQYAVDGKHNAETLARLRNLREVQCKNDNPNFNMNTVNWLLAWGEASVVTLVFGDKDKEEIDADIAESIFRRERIPDGWKSKGFVSLWHVLTFRQKIVTKGNELKKEENPE